MQWQFEWRGNRLVNTKILVFEDQLDTPQRQLGTIILPPDPPSILNARVEQYFIDEQTQRRLADGTLRLQMDGTVRIESNSQSGNTQ